MDIAEMKKTPSQHFNHPQEVLRNTQLSLKEKEEILRSWKNTCLQLQESENEGMEADKNKDLLEDVSDALITVEAQTKH